MAEFDHTDELFHQMRMDELSDATKLTPIEYGRLRGIKPQLIYYHLRTHNDPSAERHIILERCLCGKPVLDIKKADEYFGKGEFDPNYVPKDES